MIDANITDNTRLEITDVEMFALLGQKDCEIFMKDKSLERLNGQFEKLKAVIVELETIKKKNSDLEISNKSLSEQNIKLDQALTEERQKMKASQEEVNKLKGEIATIGNINLSIMTELETIKTALSQKETEIGELNGKYSKGKKGNIRNTTNA
jgi:predicted  nucleic acid-binding Zn-ribbon protein